jgi:aerobic carbon-monoxide dehydrogenase medium subunit
MYEFQYAKPSTVADAASLLAADDTNQPLAGGQTLIPTLKQRLNAPGTLVDLSGIDELTGVTRDANAIVIGAMTTHASVAADGNVREAIPALARLASGIGDPQVRNSGTIGGSLANNDPAADYPCAALALGATVRTNKREIGADGFFQGFFTTALEPGELIVSVSFPVPVQAAYGRFEQRASRYPMVGVFVAQTESGARAAVTGAGQNGVFRCQELEASISREFSAAAASSVKVPSDDLTSDLHASAEYRASLISIMAARAIEEATS